VDVERDFARLPELISKGVEIPAYQTEDGNPQPAEEKPQPKQLSLF
jgi:hypothetical protein